MRIFIAALVQLLVACGSVMAQTSTPQSVAASQAELGKWWKNSEIVKKLQLSEAQVNQIERSFLDHRRELADLDAELKRRENELKILMQSDPIDESKVRKQTEFVASARSALEKANASMMLSIRKALSLEQWKRLEEMRALRNVQDLPVSTSPRTAAPTSATAETKAASASPAERIYRMAEGIKAPLCIYQPMPSYTEEARKARIEGTMLLQAIIRKDGTVGEIRILRSLGYGLDESALDTIRNRWRFEPGTLNGQPVDVQANMEVSFRLY